MGLSNSESPMLYSPRLFPANIRRQFVLPCFLAASCLIFLLATATAAASISGTFITQGKGYQDLNQDDHFVVAQGLRIHGNNLGTPYLSFHGYFQYYGDTSPDIASSGTFRLYHGYFKYNHPHTRLNIKAGRFFLYRGVAIGVLDGGELTYTINPKWQVVGFGGIQGPLNRQWEFEDISDASMFGGEIRWRLSNRALPVLSLSYTNQHRYRKQLRHLAGVSFRFRWKNKWDVLNILHLRLSQSPLRKLVTRWRYLGKSWQFQAEASAIMPDVAAYSWFNDFHSRPLFRLRSSLEHHIIPRKWGLGISAMAFGGGEYGFQVGPVAIFPYGRIGYHHSWGKQSHNNALWGHIRYSPTTFLDLYAYAAQMEFEWETMELDAQETTMVNLGAALRPPCLKSTEWKLEWQNYKTPQLDADRRIIATMRWNFAY